MNSSLFSTKSIIMSLPSDWHHTFKIMLSLQSISRCEQIFLNTSINESTLRSQQTNDHFRSVFLVTSSFKLTLLLIISNKNLLYKCQSTINWITTLNSPYRKLVYIPDYIYKTFWSLVLQMGYFSMPKPIQSISSK